MLARAAAIGLGQAARQSRRSQAGRRMLRRRRRLYERTHVRMVVDGVNRGTGIPSALGINPLYTIEVFKSHTGMCTHVEPEQLCFKRDPHKSATRAAAAQSRALPPCDGRVRPHRRFAPPLTHFTPDSRREPAPLSLKRQCEKSPGRDVTSGHTITHTAHCEALIVRGTGYKIGSGPRRAPTCQAGVAAGQRAAQGGGSTTAWLTARRNSRM